MLASRHGTTLYFLLLVALCLATTALGTLIFWSLIAQDENGMVAFAMLAVFAVLYYWIAMGFWTATFGFVRKLSARHDFPDLDKPNANLKLPKTAIVMPIYNEQVDGVYSRLRAMYEALIEAGRESDFDFFMLSDTTDPDIWIEEELTWALLRTTCQGDGGIFYRRRAQNIQRKSGNIQDFCTRWGSHYRYMVVLDADSLVEARTLLEMVWRMEQDDRIGILQSPPMPINQRSPFARLQQFASHFYGPVFTAGYSLWSQWHGNYWGHNAIIRVQAFIDCCALPALPGESPLGGEILSHDFVEAALLHRKGWKVVVDNDLEGSYEEIPATLVEFVERDQRWCQGNLQHVRLVFSHGLQMLSRVQLGMGAMSYLASSLWAIFLVLVVFFGIGTALPVDASGKNTIALELFIGTMALLLLPKLWVLILTRLHRQDIAGFAGLRKAAISTLLETIASVLMAPILMIFHTMFVIKALGGQTVKWETGQRGGKRFTYSQLFSVCSVHTFVGLAGSLLVTWFVPGMLVWLAPVLAPLVFSIPIAMLLGSERIGNWLIDKRLLVTPYESHPTRIIRRQQSLLREREIVTSGDGPLPFDRLIISPTLNHLHIALLADDTFCDSPERMDRLKRIALAGGGAHLSKSERMEILFDAGALQWLHKNAWTDWSLDLIEQCGVGLQKTNEAPSWQTDKALFMQQHR